MVKQLSLDNDVPKRSHIDPILRKYIWVDTQNKKYIKEKNQFKQVTKYKGQYIIKKQKGRSAIVKGGYASQKGGELHNTCNTPLMDGTYFYNTELNYDTNKKYNVDIKYNTNTDETNRDHKITDECDKYYSEFLYDYYLVVEFRIVILRSANNVYTTYTFDEDFDNNKYILFLNHLSTSNKYLELFIYNTDNKYRYFIIFDVPSNPVTDILSTVKITNTDDYKTSQIDISSIDMDKFEKTMNEIVEKKKETLDKQKIELMLTKKKDNILELIEINNQLVIEHKYHQTFVSGLKKIYNKTIADLELYTGEEEYDREIIEPTTPVASVPDTETNSSTMIAQPIQATDNILVPTGVVVSTSKIRTEQQKLPATMQDGSRIKSRIGEMRMVASVGGGFRQIPKNKKSVLNNFIKSLMLIGNANNKKKANKPAKPAKQAKSAKPTKSAKATKATKVAAPRDKKVAKKVKAK